MRGFSVFSEKNANPADDPFDFYVLEKFEDIVTLNNS
jgi:hypothetical protein